MADTKVTALTELTTPAGVDLLYIVDDPAGAPLSRKCTVANLFGYANIRKPSTNTLSLRNTTNAQALEVYNTCAEANDATASNYERGFIRYSSNVLQVGHEGAGTGSTSRTLAFRTAGFNPLTLDSSEAVFNVLGTFTGGIRVTSTGSAGFVSFVESTGVAAPSANNVRIYAEDNGSGKTRLMALFATGAAQQIAIEP